MSKVLLESGDLLLLESGDATLLEDGSPPPPEPEPEPDPPPPPPAPAGKWIVLARAFLDSATENVAGKRVTHPSWEYEGRALSFGQIDRSIPVPAGMPQTGDARVRLADTDRRWRNLLARQTSRQRMMELKLVQEGASESAAEPVYAGAIVDIEFGPGYVDVTLRDRSFAWLDEEIPGFINRTNFPTLAEGIDEAFLPIIAGINRSNANNPTGILELPHIGYEVGIGDRWGLAAHPVWDAPAVWRSMTDSAGVETWELVDEAEFTITEDPRSFVEVPSLTFHPAFLVFALEQPEGTKIRVDVDGMDFRGGWEGIPPAGYHPEHNPTGTPGPLRNPIDVFINLIFLMMNKAGVTADSWEVSTIAAVLQTFSGTAASESNFAAELGALELGQAELGDSGIVEGQPPFLCDGILNEPMTVRAFLGRFLPCFELNFFQQKNGKLALAYAPETDVGRPLFDDIQHILRNSFFERLASPTINRLTFKYSHNHATGEWGQTQIQDNEDDQDALKIQEDDFLEMWWVRDPTTAAYVASRRLSFLALGSYRQSFLMPLPEVFANIELAKLVGITHWAGADNEGYLNREVLITGLQMDLDRLTVKVDSILRVPQHIVAPPVETQELFCEDFNRAYAGANNLGADWQISFKAGSTGFVEVRLDTFRCVFGYNGTSFQPTDAGDGNAALALPEAATLAGLHQYAQAKLVTYVLAPFAKGDVRSGPVVFWRGLLSTTTASGYALQIRITNTSGSTVVTALIARVVANVLTVLAGTVITLTGGDLFSIGVEPRASANAIKAWRNSTLILSVEDDAAERLTAEGGPGLFCENVVFSGGASDRAEWDDFCDGIGWPPLPGQEPQPGEIYDDFHRSADAETIEGTPATSGFNWITPLRSDGDFAPWKIRLGSTLVDRVLQATSGSTDYINYIVHEPYNFIAMADDSSIGNDQWAEMIYDREPRANQAASGPAVRCAGGFPNGSCYALRYVVEGIVWFLELVRLFERVDSTGIDHVVLAQVELARYPAIAGLQRGDALRIQAEGTTIRGLLNGVEKMSITDGTLSSGLLGMAVDVHGVRTNWVQWSRWRGGEL